MPSLEEALVGVRFLGSLPGFLRQSIDPEEARRTVTRRIVRRGADFLALAKRAVYENPDSPYRPLLAHAGCEFGDLQSLVQRDGLEGALRTLLRRGVYLTSDEFKGRRPVVRGSTRFTFNAAHLRNPLVQAHLGVGTSGSRGPRTSVPIDLAFVRDGAASDTAALAAVGRDDLTAAVWKVPGGDALWTLLRVRACGTIPHRWFSQIDPGALDVTPRYRWSARVVRLGGRLAGIRLPRPEYVRLDDPWPVLRWMSDTLRAGRTPLLHTFVSSAVRACQVALEAGVDVRGTRLMVGGEPLTAARSAVIQRATGQSPQARYASGEAGVIGLGCLRPNAPDDVHVFHDLHALVQAEGSVDGAGLPGGALFITSIRPTAPLILLNAAMGDMGVLASRACDCGLEAVGWSIHLHTIRSYEKLTAGGMTFMDTDVIRVLEEVLPRRFGGVPTDYQIVEDEGQDGRPRLRLLVRPEVGAVAPDVVRDAFLTAIGARSDAARVMELLWRDSELLAVERRAPLATASGKILHLLVIRGRADVSCPAVPQRGRSA